MEYTKQMIDGLIYSYGKRLTWRLIGKMATNKKEARNLIRKSKVQIGKEVNPINLRWPMAEREKKLC